MSISFLNKENHQEFEIKRQISSPNMTKGAISPLLHYFTDSISSIIPPP